MVEEQKRRIEDHMNRMVEELEKSYLRKMQGDMHRCAATCCDNDDYSIMKVHNCIQNCNTPLEKAQEYVHSEFNRVQERLQRCVMDCNDKIRDKMGPNPTQSEAAKYSDEFERCATKCVDTYCNLLPSLEVKMKKVLSSRTYE